MPIIPPVGIGAASGLANAAPIGGANAATEAAATERGNDFGKALDGVLGELEAKELTADKLARDAATGKLQNVEEYMIAATDAQLTMELTVAVRDKAVEAFNDIMRMQV